VNQRDVEDLIFIKLAEQSQQDPTALRAEVEGSGADLPIDSILLVEILAVIADYYGIALEATMATAELMRSVSLLAAEIIVLVDAQETDRMGQGA
jgi:acyl carrier protein